MKFAMYVINCDNQEVYGSNDAEAVERYVTETPDSVPEQFVIIYSTYGDFQIFGEEAQPIEELGGGDDEQEELNLEDDDED